MVTMTQWIEYWSVSLCNANVLDFSLLLSKEERQRTLVVYLFTPKCFPFTIWECKTAREIITRALVLTWKWCNSTPREQKARVISGKNYQDTGFSCGFSLEAWGSTTVWESKCMQDSANDLSDVRFYLSMKVSIGHCTSVSQVNISMRVEGMPPALFLVGFLLLTCRIHEKFSSYCRFPWW